MRIRLLPPNLINQIAAGEVIERPASAIKELVENSLDAGSTSIEVILREGGRSYIAVIDNGHGMTKDDLLLAVQRHATSKLPDENLFHIKTLGFRGEALPSIGSVARLKLTSKHASEEHAWSLKIEGGRQHNLEPSSQPLGTKVEVSDLFFATPARLKFLKAAQTEVGHIQDVLKRLAMANPTVSFVLRDEKRTLLSCPAQASDDPEGHLKRLGTIMGDEFTDNALGIALEQDEFSLKGYAGLPTLNRANAQYQFLFVNGRPVKDKILNHGVKVAYSDYLARDRFPLVCLFLELDPEVVDMNVHPAKTEVRFREPAKVRSIIVSALKNALENSGFRASTTVAHDTLRSFQSNASPEFQPNLKMSSISTGSHGFKTSSGFGAAHQTFKQLTPVPSQAAAKFATRAQSPSLSISPRHEGFRDKGTFAMTQNLACEARIAETVPDQGHTLDNETQHEDEFTAYPLGLARAQLHECYIIAESSDGIVIVDQHAVHERLVYEAMKKQLAENGIKRQGLLLPEVIDLTELQAQKLLGIADELEQFGLVIEGFGGNSIIVREVPALLGQGDIQTLIRDIVDDLEDKGDDAGDKSRTDKGSSHILKQSIEDILGTMACHGSIRSGRKLSILEMNELLRQMESTPFSGQCNHGRPTYIKLGIKDVERLFGRS